jgi:hypothetical protein
MPYYKSPDNSLHFIDGPEYIDLLPANSILISDQEAANIIGAQHPTPTLAERQATMWESIKTERDHRIQNGGYKVGSDWFHSDTFSRTQQIGLVMLGANLPVNLQWKTMGGYFITMTPTLAQQVFTAAATQDITTFGAAVVHQQNMLSLSTPEDYDFSIGWPAIFQG